ncbi:MAG: 2-amino-4-hydroxy-6-hydroxymethyldihydropteridine diphosphokinase [Microcystaceae cyanobacterium]|nr:2-amino-4-hydroxy-6-hydroxymethyldihydropteridine diphosphokinase [Merismopediaceae bacterium]
MAISPHQAAIALGSNLGNSQEILETALQKLSKTARISLVARSCWYETLPVGPPQPNYLNGCAVLTTSLSAQALLAQLLTVEQQFGRDRPRSALKEEGERWGPRTLDLDLLLYDQEKITRPDLTVPHPRFRERAFVLVPLAEIAPTWRDPHTQKTILTLRQEIDCSGIVRCLG